LHDTPHLLAVFGRTTGVSCRVQRHESKNGSKLSFPLSNLSQYFHLLTHSSILIFVLLKRNSRGSNFNFHAMLASVNMIIWDVESHYQISRSCDIKDNKLQYPNSPLFISQKLKYPLQQSEWGKTKNIVRDQNDMNDVEWHIFLAADILMTTTYSYSGVVSYRREPVNFCLLGFKAASGISAIQHNFVYAVS